MLPRSEGEARVDFERGRAARSAAMHWGVHVKAPGADRLEARLAHRHPVRFAELLEPRLAVAKAGKAAQLLRLGLMVEIGVDQPVVRLRRVGLVGNEDRRALRSGKDILRPAADRLTLSARARDGDPPAHLT